MNLRRFALILFLILVWGFNFVVIKVGLEGMPPVFLAFSRFFLTCFPAIFFIKRPEVSFARLTVYSLIMFSFQFACFFIGMNLGVPPGLASILMQMHVFFSLMLAPFVFKEKIKPLQIASALLSFAGIAYAGFHIEGDISILGFCLILIAAASWGIGSTLSKTLGSVNMISLIIWSSMIASPPLLLLSLVLEGPAQILDSLKMMTWVQAGAIAYITYLSTLFGYGLWSWLLHQLPISKVVPFTLLVPIIAMFSSALVLGEPLQSWKIIAALFVIGGLCLNFLGTQLLKGKSPVKS